MSNMRVMSNQIADCLFCKIATSQIPADVVSESDRALAFRDIAPQAPTHVLVVPKAHFANVGELAEADPSILAELIQLASGVASSESLDAHRLVFNTGTDAGQSVLHVHAHVLGGRPLSWPPG